MDIIPSEPFVYKGIAISGKMCSGKSTAAKYLSELLKWPIRSFAEPLKTQVATALYESGLDVETPAKVLTEHKAQVRGILQGWGNVFRALNGNQWWPSQLFRNYGTPFIIDDMRFQDELDYVRQRGFLTIRLEVDPETQIQRLQNLYPGTPHETLLETSETSLDNCFERFDIVITNPDSINRLESLLHTRLRDYKLASEAMLI